MEQALLGQGAASNRILLPTQGYSRADLPGPDSALSQVVRPVGGQGWLSWVGEAWLGPALALRCSAAVLAFCGGEGKENGACQ